MSLFANRTIFAGLHIEMKVVVVRGVRIWPEHGAKNAAGIVMNPMQEMRTLALSLLCLSLRRTEQVVLI